MTDPYALIREFEGFRGHPYQCSASRWTIGYGATRTPDGEPVTEDTPPISEAEARAWLERDCAERLAAIREMTEGCDVTPHEEAALLSFAYNLGIGSLRSSTLLRHLRMGFREGAAREFDRWIHVRSNKGELVESEGLKRRRARERALFEGRG